MDTTERIIREAIKAYPDGEVLAGDHKLKDLLYLANRDNLGDTLLSFIILELHEGLDGDETPERAVRLMETAKQDLEAVIDSLANLNIEV